MFKKLALALLAIAALTIVAGIIKFNYIDVPLVGDADVYVAQNGEEIRVHARADDSSIELTREKDGRTLLYRTASASGARYATKDDSIVFWNKGDEFFIEENGEVTMRGARIAND